MGRRAVHRCDSHLHCAERAARWSCPQLGQLTHPHPQSRPTLGAAGTLHGGPSVVLWTPGSGVGRGVARTQKGGSSGDDDQAACEPGGRGC
jgi:hypothetical protein